MGIINAIQKGSYKMVDSGADWLTYLVFGAILIIMFWVAPEHSEFNGIAYSIGLAIISLMQVLAWRYKKKMDRRDKLMEDL